MSECFPKPKYLGASVKFELDLSNYATKGDLKNAAGVDTIVGQFSDLKFPQLTLPQGQIPTGTSPTDISPTEHFPHHNVFQVFAFFSETFC